MGKINVQIRKAKYPIAVTLDNALPKAKNEISIERLKGSAKITFPKYDCIETVLTALTVEGQKEWKPNFKRFTLTLRIPVSENEGKSLKLIIEKALEMDKVIS